MHCADGTTQELQELLSEAMIDSLRRARTARAATRALAHAQVVAVEHPSL
eukprot:COSAG01_NODE_5949_length_3939_cov_3.112500_5_plen_50_part_00